MSVSYAEALVILSPNTIFNVIGQGHNYSDLRWISGPPIPPKEDLDEIITSKIKDNKWQEIKAERDLRRASGVPVSGYWFHSDDTSRIQQIGLVMMGQNLPTGIMWKTLTGQFVEMTPALAQDIFSTTASRDIQIFEIAEQHKAQMFASSDPLNYNFKNLAPFWPLVYGE